MRYVGDLHLGKTFRNGVPLHRKGEREETNFQIALESLLEDTEETIQLGDVFDKFQVSVDLVVNLVEALQKPRKHCLHFIRGNHDFARDTSRVSSFKLAKLLNRNDKVFFHETPTVVGDHVLIPFHPEGYSSVTGNPEKIACTHDDLENLPKGFSQVINGHIHVPETCENVRCVGSLYPLAHGEGDSLYVTVTAEEALEHAEELKDKCVRVLLKKGDVFSYELDCLQLTFKREEEEEELDLNIEETDLLSLPKIVAEKLEGNPLKEKVLRCLNM